LTSRRRRLACALALGLITATAHAAETLVAVAANFAGPFERVAEWCQARTGDRTRASFGSTGKLYAQIRGGAPFEVLLAADEQTPRRLESDGAAIAGTRFTYAVGRLVLWSPDPERVDGTPGTLERGSFRHLALANPDTAPYGGAARQVLQRLGLWEPLQLRIVMGENVAQAFQFVATGNAELGFVALSQLGGKNEALDGSRWLVPEKLHDPIRQQAVLLTAGRDNPAAAAFLACLRGEEVAQIVREYGYGTGDR